MAETEEFLKLFDSYWFEHKIFSPKPFPQIPKPNPIPKTNPQLTRSLSDHSTDAFSPYPNLKTEEIEIPNKKKTRKQGRNRGRSLSELEFEELKGFMDLGFVFSEEDRDSSLVSVIPGLQKQGIREIENGVSRPYLSEAWEVFEKMNNSNNYNNLLVNWKIPDIGSEIDMKDHLRVWAHTVASTSVFDLTAHDPLCSRYRSGCSVARVITNVTFLMEAEEVLNLYDFYWFKLEIFKANTFSNPSENPNPIHKVYGEVEKPNNSPAPTLQIRSLSDRFLVSDQISFCSDSPSPKIRKILSRKEIEGSSVSEIGTEMIENPMERKKRLIRRRKRISSCKSLSDLEAVELKGFVDLGFMFLEEDKDSNLVSIIPGLSTLGRKGTEEVNDDHESSRPYLSEAWGDLERKLVNRKLMDWKVVALNDGNNMKDRLRVWAQTVASTVRY